MRRCFILALLVQLACDRAPVPPAEAAAVASDTEAAPDAAAAKSLRRELTATMLGRPLGTILVERTPLPDGGERWTTRSTMTIALDDPGESAKTIETVETSDYARNHVFLRSQEDSTEDGVVESLTTEIVGKSLRWHQRGPSHDRERTVPVPDDFRSESAIFDQLRGEVAAGSPLPRTASYSSFDDESLSFERNTFTLLERVRFEHGGAEIDAWKVESRDHEDQRTIVLLDDDGMPLRMEMGIFVASVGDLPALTGEAPKLSSYLAIEGRVPSSTDKLRIAVSVTGDDPKDAPAFRDTAYQKVVREGEVYTLSLAAVRGDGLASRTLPIEIPSDVRGFLEPTATSQSDDAEIVKRAKAIIAGKTDARAAAVAITEWVHSNLGKKDGTRGAATAVETLDAGFGDCTEHAALTVAMLRAVGLPARNAGGIVLVPGLFSSDAGYHAWVEVWIGDWVALDPALGRTRVSAHYMLLGYNEPGMSSGSAALSRLIGRTRIAVVD